MEHVDRLTAALADHYRLERKLGAGGMATVYLAEDRKHHRQVAVKVLRPELAAILGGDRFLKEIEITANLQHPNILALYDSGDADGFLYYVMPYVEGETLRSKLQREQQLDVDETVEVARGVLNALGFAHARGVIHRDIKPENILFQGGQPIVADFGIALAVTKAGGTRLTETGLSLGTPHYMSPEQATGDREVDARSDLYSLGSMLYEMLVGEPPHIGNSVQAILAKVISDTPTPIRARRDLVPTNVEASVRKALAKIPADRFGTALQFSEALTNPAFALADTEQEHPTGEATRRPVVWPVAFAAMTLLAVWAWFARGDGAGGTSGVHRLVLPLPEEHTLSVGRGYAKPIDISPDGRRVVFVAESSGEPRLYVHDLSQDEAQPLPGTEGAHQPFFSPDGTWVGFFVGTRLLRAPVTGEPPVPVVDIATQTPDVRPYGADWGDDQTIVYSTGDRLWRMPSAGGAVVEIPVYMLRGGDSLAVPTPLKWPRFLPDQRFAMASAAWRDIDGTPNEAGMLGTVDMQSGEFRYFGGGNQPRLLPSEHLVFEVEAEQIRVASFDHQRPELTGSPTTVLRDVLRGPGGGVASYAVSQTGTLVYAEGGFERSMVYVDRYGRETPIALETRGYRFPRVSADGRFLAVTVDPRPSSVWVVDLERVTARRITSDGHNLGASWSPDGNGLMFNRSGTGWFRVDWPAGSDFVRAPGARGEAVWF